MQFIAGATCVRKFNAADARSVSSTPALPRSWRPPPLAGLEAGLEKEDLGKQDLEKENMLRPVVVLCLLATTAAAQQQAAPGKPAKIWNLTSSVVVELRLAPVGGQNFGRNLTLDDDDREIGLDERLALRDQAPGAYDARIVLKDGRRCAAAGLKIEPGAIVSIEEKDLRDCAK